MATIRQYRHLATNPALLGPDRTHGHHRSVTIANRRIDWLPLDDPPPETTHQSGAHDT